MIIYVCDDHIEEGRKCVNDKCPVALALIKAGMTEVNVGSYDLSFVYKGKHYYKEFTYKVQKFINSFDGDSPVQPMEFEINL